MIFDVIALTTCNGAWSGMASSLIAAGVIGGLVAAVFGLIDWLAIPSGTHAKAVGLWHGVGNVVVVALFAVSWLLPRGTAATPGTLALVLSFAGVVLALVTGWLGGELVDRLGVGVDDRAHLDAPCASLVKPSGWPWRWSFRRVTPSRLRTISRARSLASPMGT